MKNLFKLYASPSYNQLNHKVSWFFILYNKILTFGSLSSVLPKCDPFISCLDSHYFSQFSPNSYSFLTNCILHTNARLIPFFFFLKDYCFRSVLSSQQSWEGSLEISRIPAASCMRNLPIINIIQQNGTWHSIITQNPWRFMLGAVHSMSLNKCVMTYTHHDGCYAQDFHHPKNPLYSVYSSLPSFSTPISSWSFYCLHIFAFSRMSHGWTHTIRNLFRLASFT